MRPIVTALDPPAMAVRVFGDRIDLPYGDRSDGRVDLIAVDSYLDPGPVYRLRVITGTPGHGQPPAPRGMFVLAAVNVPAAATIVTDGDLEEPPGDAADLPSGRR